MLYLIALRRFKLAMDVVMPNNTTAKQLQDKANLKMLTLHNNSESFTPYWSHSSKAV